MANYYVDDNGNITTSKKKKKADYVVDRNGNITRNEEAVALTVTTKTKADTAEKKEERSWFKSGRFADGYDFGDVTKTILGTVGDVAEDAVAGVAGMGEKIYDAMLYASPGITVGQSAQLGTRYDIDTYNRLKALSEVAIKQDLYDEEEVAKKIISAPIKNATGFDIEKSSVLGEKSDALVQSGGQLLATAGLQTVGIPWFLTTGATSFGSQVETALNEGADYDVAGMSATISAGAEILTEKLSGGIKFGGKTLDDVWLKPLTSKISNKAVKALVNVGVDATGEGAEEVVSSVISNLGTSLYKEESLDEILASEEAMDEYIESFIGGAVLGGVSSGVGSIVENTAKPKITENEQKVIDKEVENRIAEREESGTKLTEKEKKTIKEQVTKDLEKGYISIDTIESALGGETYNTYKSVTEQEEALQKEYDTLNQMKQGEMTGEQIDRRTELKQQLTEIKEKSNRNQLKEQLGKEVSETALADRVGESYREKARKSQTFEADLTKYDAKQQEVVKKAVESGILNNTNRTHDFVDMLAKLSAGKGVSFDFTSNQKLKESGFALEGKTINGFVKDGNITLNIDSSKALNSVVGHEIMHVLEGTELAPELQSVLKQYATTKGEYDTRYQAIAKLYEGVEGANIEAELTADLVGDYLFTDSEFVSKLSAEKPNIFKKIYEEIKYLCKIATTGSKELRELERAKRLFEKAWQSAEVSSEASELSDSDVKYSLREEAPPKETGIAYKVFYVKDGKLYPPMVANPDGADTPMGVWLNADVGTAAPPSKTGRQQVKAGGKGTQGGSGSLAFRPGWHLGDLPRASQFDRVNPETGNKELFPENFVWAEVEYAKDVDYQEEAMSYGYTDNGKFRHAYAGLPRLPENGYYRYRTNPKPDTVPWVITGAMKVNRLLSDTEVNAILEKNGVPPVHRQGGDVDLDKFGFNNDGTIKYSLTDSDGKQLTKEQQEFFKDSKMRDENGNLKVMYHGTEDGGFHEFNPAFASYDAGMFFVDDNVVAKSYSGTHETYSAKTLKSVEDLNNFFSEINAAEYEAVEEDGKYVLYEDGDEIAVSNSVPGLFEEYRDWTGNGYGGVNYKVYLNLKNPLVVDAQNNNWDEVSSEFSQEIYDSYNSLTEAEKRALVDVVEWDDIGIFRDELQRAKADSQDEHYRSLASVYEKMGGEDMDFYGLFDVALESFSDEAIRKNAVKNLKTRDYAHMAKEQGYDGVIFNNIVDNGMYASGIDRLTSSTVAIAFDSNQIKSVDNANPTSNPDIRFSLSEDSEGRKLSDGQKAYFGNSKIVDKNGHLKVMYHGTANEFTVFNPFLQGGKNGTAEGYGIYFTDSQEITKTYGDKRMSGYLNITHPATSDKKTIKQGDLVKLIKATCEAEAKRFVEDGDYDTVKDALKDTWISDYVYTYDIPINKAFKEVADSILSSNHNDKDIIQEVMGGNGVRDYASAYKFYDILRNTLGIDGFITNWESSNTGESSQIVVAFDSNQFKNLDNINPTSDEDIRRSLSSKNEQFAPIRNGIYGKDIALETAPVQEEVEVEPETDIVLKEDYAPLTEDEANVRDDEQNKQSYFPDTIAPETEEMYNGTFASHPEIPDPFYERDIWDVGKDRKAKAYMYENPEVKPFFQEEANYMLGELNNSVKGEKMYNDQLYYDTNGEMGFFGTTRNTSEEIAYLLDTFNYTYKDIEKGLKAIIEDNGKENNAISKRIEFLLDERLRKGYTHFIFGDKIPPNQEYINLLVEKEITEYDDDSWNSWLRGLSEEDINYFAGNTISPVAGPSEYMAVEPKVAPEVAPTQEHEAIKPKPEKQPRMARVKDAEVDAPVARILTESAKPEAKKKGFWSQAMELVGDKGFVFENLAKKTKNRELEAKWNFIRYADGMAQDFIGNGEDGVRAINDLKAEVDKAGLTDALYNYVYHLHNIDRMSLEERYDTVPNKPVFGDSVTPEVSRKEVAKLEAQYPAVKKYAQEIYKINDYLRKLLVEGDVISQETADLWQEMYPHFVPIKRVDKNGLNINVPLDTRKTGINAPVKRATGGNSDIEPLFNTMANRALQTYKAVAKNRFGVELKNTLGTIVETTPADVDSVIDSVDTHEELLQKGKHGGNPTFTVFENGERVTFEISDDMYDALKPTNRVLAHTIKPLNFASNLHRSVLTEYNPAFLASNAIKDAQEVVINSQHPAKTYMNFLPAMKEMVTNGEMYREYIKNGGERNTYFDRETNDFKKDKNKFVKAIGMPLNAISTANNYVEKLPRLAEYMASRKAGSSIEVSMLDAARVTTNFSAGGDFTKFLNRNGATFLNASVQGAMQQVRNVREAKMNGLKGWMQLATKFAVAGLPAVLLNSLLWDDDEEYKELSDYVKENYYVVAKYGDGNFVRIPKGRTIAVIQTAYNQTMNALTGDDETDLRTFLWEALSNLGNLAPNNPIEENIIAPIMQVANNETWYGDDLVPTRLQDLPAEEQFDESTDLFSKWLGEKTKTSPVKINYLLDQYTGVVGDVIMPMFTPEAERGDDSTLGNFLAPIKSKFTTDSVSNNQNISDFYDTMDTLTTNAKKSNATDEDILKNKYINSVSAEMSELYAKQREIQNGDLSDKDKYNQVRELQKQIDALAKEGLHTYESVSIDGSHATVGDRQYRLTDEGWTKITDKQLKKQDEVTSGLGITPAEYWGNKEEYDYAYESPDKYSIAKAVGGYDAYKSYTSELYDIKADKDENGESIAGSAKEKKIEYINNLDLDYGQKIILFRSMYDSKTDKATYNADIVDYLNSREDVSYDQMVTILEALDFKVYPDGTVEW